MTVSVTLREVADAAEVSLSTASRALSGHPGISAERVARVQHIAESMNYQPPRKRKRDVRQQGSEGLEGKRLAAVSLGMDSSLIAVPAVADAIGGVEEAVSAAGAQLQLLNLPSLEQSRQSGPTSELDGVFLVGAMQGRHIADCESAYIKRLMKLPRVWLLGRPDGCSGDAVGVDDVELGKLAADLLADNGHQHVAFVGPKPDHLLMMRREDGFSAQGRRRGLQVGSFVESPTEGWSLPLKPPLTTDSVQVLIDRLLEASPQITALFAASDSVAALCYRALAVRGLKVGEDISVVSGNNDTALIQSLYPHLTTFDIHARTLGRMAVAHLASQMSSESKTSSASKPDVEITLRPTLVDGDSVACLNPSSE